MPRRAKAVRRPKLRAEVERGPSSLRDSIRRRFDSPEALCWIGLQGRFFQELKTPAERRAFAEVFPNEFYEIFGFFSHPTDDMPASTEFHFRIFRRPADEFLDMIEAHRPRLPFDPPDLSGQHFYPEQCEALAIARGGWWRANRLPMTETERGWLESHNGACPQGRRETTQVSAIRRETAPNDGSARETARDNAKGREQWTDQ